MNKSLLFSLALTSCASMLAQDASEGQPSDGQINAEGTSTEQVSGSAQRRGPLFARRHYRRARYAASQEDQAYDRRGYERERYAEYEKGYRRGQTFEKRRPGYARYEQPMQRPGGYDERSHRGYQQRISPHPYYGYMNRPPRRPQRMRPYGTSAAQPAPQTTDSDVSDISTDTSTASAPAAPDAISASTTDTSAPSDQTPSGSPDASNVAS